MALNIKNEETDRPARRLAELTRETPTVTVRVTLQERLQRLQGRSRILGLREEIERIQERMSRLPRRNGRSDEEEADRLVSALDEALLFVGDDFSHPDVEEAGR